MSDDNREQIEFWNGRTGGLRWVVHQEALDRTWEPLGQAVVGRASPSPGERVVDVGCGCGWTTLEIAAKVGPAGSVLGVDVSEPMLARARERASRMSGIHVELVQADASTYAFDGRADLVFSRAGVMFFRNPVTAFANLRRALRPGGRLVFMCFREKELNTWMSVPLAAAASVVGPEPPVDPLAPGPFSLSDERRLRSILAGAGFVDARCGALDHDLLIGTDVEAATGFSVDAGPVARVLAGADAELRARALDAVRRALAAHGGPAGVSLRAAAWIVEAANPT